MSIGEYSLVYGSIGLFVFWCVFGFGISVSGFSLGCVLCWFWWDWVTLLCPLSCVGWGLGCVVCSLWGCLLGEEYWFTFY